MNYFFIKLKHFFKSILSLLSEFADLRIMKLGYTPLFNLSSRIALEQWVIEMGKSSKSNNYTIGLAAIKNRRWIEWSIFVSCYFITRGYKPIIIFSQQQIDKIYGQSFHSFSRSFWTRAREISEIAFIDLDGYVEMENNQFHDFAESKKHLVAAYNLGLEEHEFDGHEFVYQKELARAETEITNYGFATKKLLHEIAIDHLVVPSGLIDLSVPIAEAAKRLNKPAIFVEGWSMRPGHMIWRKDKPALRHNISGWMKKLAFIDSKIEKDIRDYMDFREGYAVTGRSDDWLENFHQVHRNTKETKLPVNISDFISANPSFFLLGTNVIGDSATLGRKSIFQSQHRWIEEVIRFFELNSDLGLIIRIHPDETWVNAKQRLGKYAQLYAAGLKNVMVIDSDNETNTFSMADNAIGGLVWLSNLGVDLVTRGKPVILAANATYAELNICKLPKTKNEYFREIKKVAKSKNYPTENDKLLGKLYHYILFNKLSLAADSPKYEARDYKLNNSYLSGERKIFFKILSGELTEFGEVTKK